MFPFTFIVPVILVPLSTFGKFLSDANIFPTADHVLTDNSSFQDPFSGILARWRIPSSFIFFPTNQNTLSTSNLSFLATYPTLRLPHILRASRRLREEPELSILFDSNELMRHVSENRARTLPNQKPRTISGCGFSLYSLLVPRIALWCSIYMYTIYFLLRVYTVYWGT